MGNCIESCVAIQSQAQSQREEKPDGFEKSNIRVKIVLTKDELNWLLFQIKGKNGKKLEDVLLEIERGREKVDGVRWKPSLGSITETPEVCEMDF